MKRKVFKVSLLLITCCLMIGLFFVITNPSDLDVQEKNKVEKAINSYLQYLYNFHKYPEDKVNIKKLDDTILNNIIDSKKQEVKKYIKEGTNLYNEQCINVENAFKQQNGESIIVKSPNIDNKGNIISSSQIEKKVEPSDYLDRSFGGYCDNIKFNNVTINGNTARVELEYKAHIIDGFLKDGRWDKKEISGDHYGYLDLEKDESGNWHITNELIHKVLK